MSTNDSFSWGAESLGGGDTRNRSPENTRRQTSLLGARMAAVIIDGLVLLVPVFGIAWLLSLAFPHHGFFFAKSGVTVSNTGTTRTNYNMGAPGWLVICALSFSYFFVFEALRGQTVGKRAMGLRVRASSGGRPGLNAISARTVLRLIDVLALFYLLGALVALLSGRRRRRIGDWAAGTVVVRDDDAPSEAGAKADWRVAMYPALWISAALLVIFASGLGETTVINGGVLERSDSCFAAGISGPEGREGVCMRVNAAGQATTFNVVDRTHPLLMPEYEARLLEGYEIRYTRVTNGAENPSLYPGGNGQLVSLRVTITNTRATPLAFGAGTAGQAGPHYSTGPLIELALPPSPGNPTDMAFPAIINGRRAPTPSIFQEQPIAPHQTRTGWVSFVAPTWSPAVLNARPADLNFLPTTGNAGYVGQIRLWK
jgi:uncharacterized RDD family membrane protein YckC